MAEGLTISKFKKITGLIFAATITALFLSQAVFAIARGYTTDDSDLEVGMTAAISVKSSDSSTVERATQDNGDQVVGIVTTVDNSLVTVSSGKSRVLVEGDGQVDAYVSDINGTIKKGDLLVLSPLKGILMRSGDTAAVVVGIAASNLDEKQAYGYQDKGETKQTQIGKIKIDLSHKGSNGIVEPDSSLGRLGRAVVGKPVSDVRVVVALIIFFIVLITEGSILYGAISSAVTALGRNPLARKIIRSELIRVTFIALIVLIIGLGAMYAILWV